MLGFLKVQKKIQGWQLRSVLQLNAIWKMSEYISLFICVTSVIIT